MSKLIQHKLSSEEFKSLMEILRKRFDQNILRHNDITWQQVSERLAANKQPEKLWSLNEMERTAGEPDVIKRDKKSGEITFVDCAAESPSGRRSICYDHAALNARKENKPKDSAMHMAEQMGVEVLSEEEYRLLQTFGKFDLKTSSWIKTPTNIRSLGGALFCDCRYNHVFVYHNGAESYYAARGFRSSLKI